MNLHSNAAAGGTEGAVLRGIRDRAGAADRGETTLAADLEALHDSGLLAALVSHTGIGGDAAAGVRLLRRIGRASLSVGRIVEGHANAMRLVQLYGAADQRARVRQIVAQGGTLGVWGAEGRDPLRFEPAGGGVLRGAKMFCSGLGLLSVAVVTAPTDAGPQMLLARADDPARADATPWDVSGMRATASGRYDFTGVAAEPLGQPGDILREPHFEGGVWRYCALHCGGLEALADGVRRHFRDRAQADQPQQAARLAQLVVQAQTARLWVEAAAAAVEQSVLLGDKAVPEAVTLALLARQAVETACRDGIALTERAMGTAAFAATSDVDRMRRDLAFFLRQANLDGKLAEAARALMADPTPVGEMWP